MSDHVARQLGHDRVSDALDRQSDRIQELLSRNRDLTDAATEVIAAYGADLTGPGLTDWADRLEGALAALRTVVDR